MTLFLKKLPYYFMVSFVCAVAFCITLGIFAVAFLCQIFEALYRWLQSIFDNFKLVFYGVFFSLGGLNSRYTPPQKPDTHIQSYRGSLDNDFI